MGAPTFVSLGENDRLAKLLAGVMPEARIISAACLEALGPLAEDPHLHILVDPRSVRPCCVKQLKRSARRRNGLQAIRREEHRWRRRGEVLPKDAWDRREEILALEDRTAVVGIFIALAKAMAQEQLTVREGATALRMSTRQLHRLVVDETECAPHIILALARVSSVEAFLRTSSLSLPKIAALHRFPNQPVMNRLFKGYVGTSPGVYRGQSYYPQEYIANVRN